MDYLVKIRSVQTPLNDQFSIGANRLWLYTDNWGLVQLWNEHRDDNRLNELRRLAASLEKFTLRAIPRLHNQPANALARAARTSASPG